MKKLILFGIVFLLFASFASASLHTDLLRVYNNDETEWMAESVDVHEDGRYNLSIHGGDPAKNVSCGVSGDCVVFDGDDSLNIPGIDMPTGVISLSMWVRPKVHSPSGTDDWFIGNYPDKFYLYLYNLDNKPAFLIGSDERTIYANATGSVWTHYVFIANTTGTYLYVNGEYGEGTDPTSEFPLAWLNPFSMGCQYGFASGFYTGEIDEVLIYNRSLSPSEAAELYTTFYPFYPPGPSDTLNLSAPLPINESSFNVPTVNFNLTYNGSFQTNCSIYLNNTWNQTINEFSAGTNIAVDFNVTFGDDGEYDYIIGCWDGMNDTNTSSPTFYIDLVDPTLAVDATLSSNRSMSYRAVNITSSVNCSDTNLWGLNITIDGTIVVFNITGISGSTYNYNLNFNPETYGLNIGEHDLTIEVSDSHTTNMIPDYFYEKNPLSKSITYRFGNGWIKVNPTTVGLFSSFDTWKNKDRYVFEFERDLTGKLLYGTDLEFEISSSHKLEDLDSEFPGHLISPDLKKWIDFDSQYKDAIITTTRINDKKFRVFIEGIEDDVILFNSLGGLNVIEENFTFYYGNFTEDYRDDNVLETETTKFSINFTINDSYVGDIDALLNWDGTYYSASTKTTSSDSIYFEKNIASALLTTGNETNKSFFWNYTITNAGAGNNIYNNTTDTKNQTLYKMIVSNCTDSIATTTAINYSVLDVIFGTPAYVVSEASFIIWNESSSTTRTYGLDWDNSTSFNLCIWPAWATFYTDYRLLYTGYGDTNSRIRTADTLDNVIDYVTLYLATEGENININVVDENDDAIEDLDVEAWIYNVAEANYTLVSEESTDPDGLAVMRLYTAGEDEYRFLIYDGGILLYTSSRFKIYKTGYTFRIVLGTIPNSTLIALQNLEYSLSADKVGENFTLTWNDVPTSLITKINLTVVKSNTTDYLILNSQSSAASSGLLEYNVTGGYGTYIAHAYMTSSGDGEVYLLDSVSLDLREEWEIFGTDALLMSFFFIGTMIFTGLAFSGEIALIATIFGMIVFFALGFIQVGLTGVVSIIISAIIILVRLKK